MNPFETETMADLYLRQGHRGEALAIYRRLWERTDDLAARDRLAHRMAALAAESVDPTAATGHRAATPRRAAPRPPEAKRALGGGGEMGMPGVRARWSTDELTIEWRLPQETEAPTLEVLLVKTGAGGVSTERRAIAVGDSAGQLKLGARNLHSVRVAAGSRGPRGFVPLVRG